MSGKLISFEGIDCSGKGTQIALLQNYLMRKRIRFVVGREPGGTNAGEAIRTILKNPKEAYQALFERFRDNDDYPNLKFLLDKMKIDDTFDIDRCAECEMFLFMASRAEHAQKIIKPILQRGTWFIADRLLDSTVAYQGGGRFHGDTKRVAEIDAMNRIALAGILPNLTLLLDIPVDVMYERMARQESADKNSFFEERCPRDFFEQTRAEYLRIAVREPFRFKIIDGTKPVSEVTKDINKFVDALLA